MAARRVAISALLGACVAGLAQRGACAAAAGERLELDAIWAGLRMGSVVLRTDRSGDALSSELSIESTGLAALVTDWRGWMGGTAHRLVPRTFRMRNASTRYTRDIEIDYDASGKIARLDIRKRGEPQKLPFDATLTEGTVDPLTAIARLRAWAAAGVEQAALEHVFDGRTRYDLHAERIDGAPEQRHAKVSIRPIAGVSRSSWLKSFEPDDGRWVEAKLSADARAVPRSLEPRGADTSARVLLVRDVG